MIIHLKKIHGSEDMSYSKILFSLYFQPLGDTLLCLSCFPGKLKSQCPVSSYVEPCSFFPVDTDILYDPCYSLQDHDMFWQAELTLKS